MTVDQFSFAARLAAALVWTVIFIRVARGGQVGGTRLRRSLVTGTVTILMWGLVARGATILGLIPDNVTAPIIAAILSASTIVGLGLLTTSPDA